MAHSPDWPALIAAYPAETLAEGLASLPASIQKQVMGAVVRAQVQAQESVSKPPAAPWEMGAVAIDDWLREAELPLYGLTFAEYEYKEVHQLTDLGRDGFRAALSELGVTSDHTYKLERLAFSARPCGTSGGALSRHFLSALRPTWSMHMGVENMGLLLYAFTRFVKPESVLEVGAGYTSLWLLQALADNQAELGRCDTAVRAEGYRVGPGVGDEWVRSDVLAARATPKVHLVDNCGVHGCGSDAHTTAHRVVDVARELGLEAHLQLHVMDAYDLPSSDAGRSEPSLRALDLIWLDFGVGSGKKLVEFLDAMWPRLRPGGHLLVDGGHIHLVIRRLLPMTMGPLIGTLDPD